MKSKILQKTFLVLLLALFASWSATAQTASVWTDKLDYAPGEFVIIEGSGFLAFETVELKIEHLTYTTHPVEYIDVTANYQGGIYYDLYQIDLWDWGETFQLTATGLTSFRVATTIFTDGDANSGEGTMTVTPAFKCSGGTNLTYTFSFNGGSGNKWKNGAALTMEVPWTITTTNVSTANLQNGATIGTITVVPSTFGSLVTIPFYSANNAPTFDIVISGVTMPANARYKVPVQTAQAGDPPAPIDKSPEVASSTTASGHLSGAISSCSSINNGSIDYSGDATNIIRWERSQVTSIDAQGIHWGPWITINNTSNSFNLNANAVSTTTRFRVVSSASSCGTPDNGLYYSDTALMAVVTNPFVLAQDITDYTNPLIAFGEGVNVIVVSVIPTSSVKYYINYGTPSQAEITSSHNFGLGTSTQVTVVAVNACATTTATFMVYTGIPAKITCPSAATIKTSDDMGYDCLSTYSYSLTYDGAAAQNPSGAGHYVGNPMPTVEYSLDNSTFYTWTGSIANLPKGGNTIYLKVTNVAGTQTCSFLVTVEDDEAPVVSASDGTSTVACIADAVAPNVPAANDNCDGTIAGAFVNYVDYPDPLTCEGTRVYTYSYTDLASNVSYWTYTYTIEYEDFTMPADDGLVVECPDETDVVPTPPTVYDNCGVLITPTGPTVSTKPACEGDRTYVWNYADCEGNIHDWTYTYTVDRTTPPSEFGGPVATASTIECIADAMAPTLPVVKDVCGAILTPTTVSPTTVSPTMGGTYVDCEGTYTYTYHYIDCAGLTYNWTYTYTIDRTTPPSEFDGPVATSSNVQCESDATAPTVLPVVKDVCGATLQPTTTSPVRDASNYDGCIGAITYTYTYTDCAKLSYTWTYTYYVEDNTPPVITAPTGPIVVTWDPAECGKKVIYTVNADDNCDDSVTPTVTPASETKFGCGTTQVNVTAADHCGNTSTASFDVTVEPYVISNATVSVSPTTQQYSDEVTFTATIPGGDYANCPAASAVTFYVRGQNMGTVQLVGDGTDLTGELTTYLCEDGTVQGSMEPGNATVEAVFTANTCYVVNEPATTLTITPEDIVAMEYTGMTFSAANNSGTAVVQLKVIVWEDSLDGHACGDIGKACVTFYNDNTPIATVPVLQVLTNDIYMGVAAYNYTVSLNNNEPARQMTIGWDVDCYYKSALDYEVVTVYKNQNDFITGGGYFMPTAGAGTYAPTPCLKNNFGYHVKFNKKGTNLQGGVNIIIRRDEPDPNDPNATVRKVYQIKSNATQSLTACYFTANGVDGKATFASKANLTDVTDPLNPVPLGGNLNLYMTTIDNGEPGNQDAIAVELWTTPSGGNGTPSLLYSNNWVSYQTAPMLLGNPGYPTCPANPNGNNGNGNGGGNLVVHAGYDCSNAPAKITDVHGTSAEAVPFMIYPNPSNGDVTIQLPNDDDPITLIRVMSMDGKIIRELKAADIEGLTNVNVSLSNVSAGMYYVMTWSNKAIRNKEKLIIVR
jgi:hypothetical protein